MNVDRFLQGQCVEYDMIPHRATYDAQRMAEEIQVSGHEVAKTVLLRTNHGSGAYIVAVLPANKRVDLNKACAALNEIELHLATEEEIAERCPDCEPGALPPFGSHYGMRTIVDESLCKDETIAFEGNTHDQAIRMRFADYQRIAKPLIASFARDS